MKKILSILMLLVAIVTGVKAADLTNPATVVKDNITFLNVAGMDVNVEETNYLAINPTYWVKKSGETVPAWMSNSAAGSNGTSATDTGFLPTASNYNDINKAYGYLNAKSTGACVFYVTGIEGTAIIGQNNSSNKKIQLSVQEYDEDKKEWKTAIVNTGTNTSAHVIPSTATFSSSKYYKITVDADNDSNNKFYQIRLTKSSAPAVPTLTGAWKIGEDDVTGETADVVQGATAPSIPTFTVGATSGTPTTDNYQVAYSETGDEGIFTYTDGVPTGISTTNAGSATITATLTTKDNTKYLTPETNTFTYTVTVSEAQAPQINVSGAPENAVKVGTTVTLTATATGVPTPTITWYNGSDEPVATVEGTELAYTVPTTTAGTYTFYAVASNGVEPNATSAVQTVVVKEQVATPTFNPNGAYFGESQSVEIASATEDAVIEYSTDNGESWTAYTGALNITETTTIIAKATKQDYLNSETATATFTKVNLTPQADVTSATTWNWSDVTNSSAVDFSGTILNGVDVTYENISAYGLTAVSGLAAQDALLMNGQRAYNNANDSKHCQVNYLQFNATVGGTVTVEYANTGNNAARTVNVNGTKGSDSSEANNSYKSETFAVGAGSVLIKGVQVSDDVDKMLRIRKVVFTPFAAQNITVGETGFATVGLPFATTVPEGVTAYAVESVTGSKVKMSAAIPAGTTIPANKGFVIVAAKNTYTFTEVATAEYEGTDILEAVGATPKAATPEAPIYVLAVTGEKKVGFKKATSGSLGAYKAYLPGTVSTLTSLSASFDDDPTAVDAIAEADEADAEAPVKVIKNGKLYIGNYNVAGQQVK